MVEFKVVVSAPKSKKSYQKAVDHQQSGLMGKKLGDKFKGDVIGLSGYELEITGGSDKDGFPMRKDVDGAARKRLLVTSGVGFHSKKKGERKRKSIRGNTISQSISQINTKIITSGSKPVEKLLGKSEEKAKGSDKEKTEEAPKVEEKPVEAPKEELNVEEKLTEEPKTENKEQPTEEKKE
jgi:small subunit ribosomal protein S6e